MLSAPKDQHCRGGKRQYTHASIGWTVPLGFPYDEPGPQMVDYEIGRPCPRFLLGASLDVDSDDGLGEVRPRRIWLGGDSSTVYYRARWRNWGRKIARATARSYVSPPYTRSVRVKITASRLLKCDLSADYMYSRVSFRKGHRRAFVQTYSRAC